MSLADRLVLKPDFSVRVKGGALDKAAERIAEAFPGLEKRAPEDVPIVLHKVEGAYKAGHWQGVTSGDVGIAVYEHLREKIELSQGLRLFLDQEMKVTTNPTLIDAMCRGYLVSWSKRAAKTRILSNLLAEKASELPTRWRTLFEQCPAFLDFDEGTEKVAAKMVDVFCPYQWLKTVGLPAPHEVGFMREAHFAFLRQAPDPKDETSVDKILDWVSPPNISALLEPWVAKAVEKVLSPWITADCPEPLREFILVRLVTKYGDPRSENRAFWHIIDQTYRRILLKWLARTSMEAIFEIVSRAEKGTEHGHQWAQRKRFWMSLYDQGHIEEAWVALDAKAAAIAADLFRQTGNKAYLNSARQKRRDTCLLFMRVGEKTVVEGSNNFRVHLFPNNALPTPSLYEREYDLEDLLLPRNHPAARRHDPPGHWMEWVQRRVL